MNLILERPLAFFDLESTGVDTLKDKIVEIAIVKLMPNGERLKKRLIINPGIPIPQQATDVHGITNEMVQNAPTFKEVANEIYQFLENCDLAGFNSNRFDIPMLSEEFLRIGLKIDFKTRNMVDVQTIFHKMEQRNLTAAYKFYCQKDLENAHSALADTEATVDILLAQVAKYESLKNSVTELAEFSKGADLLDYARRLVLINNVPCFNFGKYKGIPLTDVFKKEPQYYDWIMKSEFHIDTKEVLSEYFHKFMLKK